MTELQPVLECPDCHRGFAVVHGDLTHGIASCGCRELAMDSGVVVSAAGPPGRATAEAIRAGDRRGARAALLHRFARRLDRLEHGSGPVTYRGFLRHALLGRLLAHRVGGALFSRLGRLPLLRLFWGAGQWNLYMRFRTTTPSFLAARAALGLVEGRSGLVLDAPSGMGHLTHHLGRVVDPGRVVAVDLDPASAYATRRFFAPRAAAVLGWDLNDPLPLPTGAFGAIFCVDAFHYVHDKQALAREFVRLLGDDGVLAILHLHNRLRDNPTPGEPLSPQEYAALFDGAAVRMFPEEVFLRAHLEDRSVDLTASAPAEDLDGSDAIMLLVARRESAFTVLDPVRDGPGGPPVAPRLNEMYRVRDRGGGLTLQLRVPPTLAAEYPRMRDVVPREVRPSAGSTPGRVRFDDPAEMLRRGVLLDLPADY